MKSKVTRDKLEQLWGDPGNWRAGLFYRCPDDPRVIVPKQQKWRGWTLNFAHRCAIPILIVMILVVVLPLFFLAVFGLAGTSIWWTSLISTVAIVGLPVGIGLLRGGTRDVNSIQSARDGVAV
jgi:hypothetical protein